MRTCCALHMAFRRVLAQAWDCPVEGPHLAGGIIYCLPSCLAQHCELEAGM